MIFSFQVINRIAVAAVLLSWFVGPTWAVRECPAVSTAQNRTSQKSLKLAAKDPETWKIIPYGAKGAFSFNENTGVFTFTADRLAPRKEYSLVRHDQGEIVGDLLAKGTSDQTGRLSLTGTWNLWRGKVWLVPTEHTASSSGRLRLTTWNPKQILFEEKVLGVVYPCNSKK